MHKINYTVVVIMGGNSSEREVSLNSGNAVLAALKEQKIQCFAFDWLGDNLDLLFKEKFDKVFIALHGKGGEDGFIQQELESRNIPYTGTNSKNSKNCMDKNITKQICQQNKLPVTPWVLVKKLEKIPSINFPLPWAIKPTLEGSSVGISKVTTKNALTNALNNAFKYGDEVIIEQWITGKEYTVAIVNDKILPVIAITPKSGFYDYKAKYQSDDTTYICPANISTELTNKVQEIAKQTYNIMGMSNWGRVDFIQDRQDNFYILEVNTSPGMTKYSLVPTAARAIGINFQKLVINILNEK